jgi:hypothetical protein
VCASFLLLSFKLSSGCLFSSNHVNEVGVQKATPQVTLYEPHDILRFLRASLMVLERSQEVRTSLLILSIVQRFQSKMASPFR